MINSMTPEVSPTCPLDVTKIAPRLYQGSVPLPGRFRDVARCGFNMLVLAAKEFQPPMSVFPGVRVYHVPLDDAEPTSRELDMALRAAGEVARAVRIGQNVLVTCMMGRNRSGLVVALAMHMLTGRSGISIVRHIQYRRTNALSNPYFVGVLNSLRHKSVKR